MRNLITCLMLLLNFMLVKAQNQLGNERKDSICVTVKELIQNPKKFDKKYIAVSGFILFEKKGRSAIYISENDFKNQLNDNCVWLSFIFESSSHHITSNYNKVYGTIVGFFNEGPIIIHNGYTNKDQQSNNGIITDISSVF
jgi:hypothetical protein